MLPKLYEMINHVPTPEEKRENALCTSLNAALRIIVYKECVICMECKPTRGFQCGHVTCCDACYSTLVQTELDCMRHRSVCCPICKCDSVSNISIEFNV